jgi:hypothetical protein
MLSAAATLNAAANILDFRMIVTSCRDVLAHCEQYQSRQENRSNPQTKVPSRSQISQHTFCRSLIMRMSRSERLLSAGIRQLVVNRR